jgi:hypothetical protein
MTGRCIGSATGRIEGESGHEWRIVTSAAESHVEQREWSDAVVHPDSIDRMHPIDFFGSGTSLYSIGHHMVERSVISNTAFGWTLTACWLAKWLLKSNKRYLNRDTWQPFGRLDSSDRTLGLRPVDSTGASGQVEQYPFVLLMALFFVGAYKYVLTGSRGPLLVNLNILTSLWA